MSKASAYRIFAAPDGESRVEELEFDATPAPGDHWLILHRQPASESRVVLASSEWTEFGPTASRRYLILMRGSCTVETSDHQTSTFGPGDLVLFEDFTGKGHRTRGDGLAMVILLDATHPPAS